ncbi:MAG: Dihydrolipoyllysine-residue succinyltransferase component of 2-oxoglutarate dehydrogenase complex [Chlamydiia bacterium]|nr:Dihydrolipoyllysine-residue succinyltransferase component of 2-oxoglutarate dehydrogenase complex [Chlamydiia bacterium]
MSDVVVPSAGESVTEATVAEWIVSDGDFVEKDQEICVLETDKASSTVYATESGTISLKAEADQTVQVGEVIAQITPGKGSPAPKKGAPAPAPEPVSASDPEPPSPPAFPSSYRAREGIDELLNTQEPVPPAPAPPPVQEGEVVRKKLSRLRKTIASRLVQAKNTTAMLTTFNEVDMTEVMAIRKREKDRFLKNHDVKLGFMSFFVKACCYGLKELPEINGYLEGDEIVYLPHVNMGIAVSTPTGLVVPVLKKAETLTFSQIEKQIGEYALKAREKKITMDDMKEGTFTITNGGTFGSLLSTPILNIPQTAILGMHAIKERAMVVNGQIEIRPMMYLALSYDHQVIDGKEAVTFLVKVKEALEDPTALFVEEY